MEIDQQIDQLIALHEGSWQRGYHNFPGVVKRLGLRRGAEIGVAFGGHAEAILDTGDAEMLYCIDSYRHRPEYDDPMNLPQPVFDRLYERTGERLSRFGGRFKQIREDSVQAAGQIDEQLDFAYIDGDHSYAGVRADLEAWFPKIRVGGVVAGHDYGQPAFPGVRAVVDAFFHRFGLTVTHEGDGVWWVERPATPVSVVFNADSGIRNIETLYGSLRAAGLEEDDEIVLVGTDSACAILQEHLGSHTNTRRIGNGVAAALWQAVVKAAGHLNTPFFLPVDGDHLPGPGEITQLRSRISTTGTQAASLCGGTATTDFGLGDLLACSTPPIAVGRTVFATRAWARAWESLAAHGKPPTGRLIPWAVLMQILAAGGRMALAPGRPVAAALPWSADECRGAAAMLAPHHDKLSGIDLLRLNRSAVASCWLNTLSRRPVRLLDSVRPADVQPVYITPRIIDRVVHKIRRTMKSVA